jgi:hypothetical protein
MTKLRRLGATVVLLSALALTAFADCPDPGQIDRPPCTASQAVTDDSTAFGQMGTPSASLEAPLVELPSLAEIALNVLTLF